MPKKTIYASLGVEARKESIAALKSTTERLFPYSFCDITRDPDFPDYGLVTHTDGAGGKPIVNYLMYRESGDSSYFFPIAQDVVAMNLDDIICIGAHPITFVDYIAINPFTINKKDFCDNIANGFQYTFNTLNTFDITGTIDITFSGGETADLPDQLRTVDVSGTIIGRVLLSEAITGNDIEHGNIIIGLRSGGKTSYEKIENSGLMCNGITLARHSLLELDYVLKYPEIADMYARKRILEKFVGKELEIPSKETEENYGVFLDKQIRKETGLGIEDAFLRAIGEGCHEGILYWGKYKIDDYIDELEMTIDEALICPTRLFAPVIKKILDKQRENVTSLVHNTGGGQTKCLNIGKNIHYVKDNPIEPDPIFELIQKESNADWKEMYQNFNMGGGFDVIIKEEALDDILDVCDKFGIGAQKIGFCEKITGKNKVTISTEYGRFEYT